LPPGHRRGRELLGAREHHITHDRPPGVARPDRSPPEGGAPETDPGHRQCSAYRMAMLGQYTSWQGRLPGRRGAAVGEEPGDRKGRAVTQRSSAGGVAAGVEPLEQRRVSVVCRSTRVDLSLPAHLELVSVIPEIVDLVRDHVRASAGPGSGVDVDARMGGGTGGSWQLSRMAGGPLAVSETLAQQRVHDGEILVLDHRPVPTPAPLFDDVLQGLTEPDVARSAAWDRGDAVLAATATVGVAAA